jgi:hypothetical protein
MLRDCLLQGFHESAFPMAPEKGWIFRFSLARGKLIHVKPEEQNLLTPSLYNVMKVTGYELKHKKIYAMAEICSLYSF